MSGFLVLAVVAALLVAFGVWKHLRDGRMRADSKPALTPDQIGEPLGEQATLVQFTSAFCAPCRATRRILQEVAAMVPGVKHVDLDVDDHLELVRELEIQRTPTIFVLDAQGAIVKRASGQPRKADVVAALGEAIPA
jgi:thiol-disulfide isomerase/thioredoxin